jgi:hypothetical protein
MGAALLKRRGGSPPALNDEEIPAAIELAYYHLDLLGASFRERQQHLPSRFRPQLQYQGRLGIGLRGDHDGSSASDDAAA